MSKYDDVRKPVQVLKPDQKTVAYKQGNKTEVSNAADQYKRSVFNGSRPMNPMLECIEAETPKKKAKKEHKVDPFMVRQGKLAAAKQRSE